MNISDLIMSQLTSPDVLSKLGGLIGANDSQTKTATSAAVPIATASAPSARGFRVPRLKAKAAVGVPSCHNCSDDWTPLLVQ